jgi:hypothetical protein
LLPDLSAPFPCPSSVGIEKGCDFRDEVAAVDTPRYHPDWPHHKGAHSELVVIVQAQT